MVDTTTFLAVVTFLLAFAGAVKWAERATCPPRRPRIYRPR